MFVVKKIDFEDYADEVVEFQVIKMSDSLYSIELTTASEVRELSFKSIGIVNTNTQSQSFTVSALNDTASISSSGFDIDGDDWLFFVGTLLFICLMALSFLTDKGGILHFVTMFLGVALAIHAYNHITTGLIPIAYFVAGVSALLYGMFELKG